MSEGSIGITLGRLRRRTLWIAGVTGLAWGLVAAGAFLLAAVWVDLVLELSPGLRVAALAFAIAIALVMLAAVVWHGVGRGRPAMLARRLDHVGRTGGQILSGVDLSTALAQPFHSHNPDLSAALAKLAVHRAEQLAAGIPRAQAVPVRPASRAWGWLIAALALTLALALAMPRLAATEWRRFLQPFEDHPPYSLVTFTVEPGDATVLYGEGLDIHATTSGPPVESLELVLGPSTAPGERADLAEQTLPMFAEPGGRWRISLSNLTADTQYVVRSGQARSHRFQITVVTVPRFEDVRFRITPPAYTRLADYNGPLPQGGLAGLRGTRVAVRANSNRPLAGGSLAYISGDARHEVALAPAGRAHEVTGAFEIDDSGRIELSIVDRDRQPSTEAWSAPVVRLMDERPFVRLLQPPPVSFATPEAVVPVSIAAEDDYGISRLQLFRSLNDSRALPLEITVVTPPQPRTYHVVQLPLAGHGLEAGDEIKLFARAEDNDPHAGVAGAPGKGAESAVVLIRIISQEDFQHMLRTREGIEHLVSKYQQARRRMESLADEIETLRRKASQQPGDEALKAPLRQELEQLVRRLNEEADALQKLQDSELPFALDRELSRELEKLTSLLRRQSEQAQFLMKHENLTGGEMQEALAELLRELDEGREHLDTEAVEPLQFTAAALRLAQDEARFVELVRRQRDLADRLASLAGRSSVDDPAQKSRMRDLEAEQRRLREDLAELLADIEEHASHLPEDEALEPLRKSALEFVAALRESGAADAMSEAEAALAEFSGARGHAAAVRAAEILEQFLSRCEGLSGAAAGRACRQFRPSLGDAMSQTIQQMLSAMRSGSGMGFGSGSGDGYSARTGALNNVGLFGGLPLLDSPSGVAGATDSQHADAARRGAAPPPTRHQPWGPGAPPLDSQAVGSGEAAVPLPYRQKVGRYFQRIADEIGDQ
ncbi:MAG: hypothetical protein KY476_11655 [Planctomycetes bacterium]|nr:hypothetical protein [Planctomycetota bacterium]